MIKTFQIDFVRAIFEEVIKDNKEKLGTNEQYKIYDFYEHLATEEEVDRYVETFREIADQQNRTNVSFFGVLSVSDNPSITNLRTAFISPFEWQMQVRTSVAYKEDTLNVLYNLIERLKGRKIDIAQFEDGTLLPVGTLTNEIKQGDYIATIPTVPSAETLKSYYDNLIKKGLVSTLKDNDYVYFGVENRDGYTQLIKCRFEEKLQSFYRVEGGVPKQAFNKYKLDLSFDDIKLDEPMVLNGEETVWYTISGSATLVDSKVFLDNDIVRFAIRRKELPLKNIITFNDEFTWIEPLEMPSTSNANTLTNQLRSNNFIQTTHTDSLAITMQYSFVIDLSIPFIKALYKYARYGTSGISRDKIEISPNIVYEVKEITSSWGKVDINTFNAKIVSGVDIEQTESGVMTLLVPLQVQGAK